jgi:hypothetical protein
MDLKAQVPREGSFRQTHVALFKLIFLICALDEAITLFEIEMI